MNTLAPSFLIRSSSFLQVTRICMKASRRLSQDQGCFYYLGHVMQKLLNCPQVLIEYFLINLKLG